MSVSFNIYNDFPTVVYPNGGESISNGTIEVQWKEPSNISTLEMVWYEVFITDKFDIYDKDNFLQIATVPSGNSSYTYNVDKNLKGNKCRIGIRAVNHKGIRGNMSISASDFSIVRKSLSSPYVLEPIPGETYFSYIPFIFDYNASVGRCSQRASYQIYYKSDKQNIDWTLLKSNILVGSDSFSIDVSDFNTSPDYSFKIEMTDGDEVSPPLFLDGITINNANYFLIDTTPPKGSVKVINNKEYINEKNIMLEVSAYDGTSDVKEFRIEQTNVNSIEAATIGSYSSMSPLLTWDIQGLDGVKLIQARFKDYGDNVIESGDNKSYFRTYKNVDNQEITSILYVPDEDAIYFSFAGDENTSGDRPKLYKNQTFLFTLDGDATALAYFDDVLYISIKDSNNKGILQRVSSNEIELVSGNEDQYLDEEETITNSLYYSDSIINTMEIFDATLFLGLQNGKLLSFDGSSMVSENDDYLNIKSIRKLKTDGNLLYIFFDNSIEIATMRKDNSGNYVFDTISTEF